MKAAIIYSSLTGNTRTASELIAANLQQEGWGVTSVSSIKELDMQGIQEADMVIVGTWVHGLFVVGQTPWNLLGIANLPPMRGKLSAAFCTFALNPGKSLDKLDAALTGLGTENVGGLALH